MEPQINADKKQGSTHLPPASIFAPPGVGWNADIVLTSGISRLQQTQGEAARLLEIGCSPLFGLSFRVALTDGHQEEAPLGPLASLWKQRLLLDRHEPGQSLRPFRIVPIAPLTLEVSVRLAVQPDVVPV